jgi:two-component system response regulator PilR (NtrC family)
MSRLLIIEDDNDLRFLYETTLAREGHEVVAAPNTVEALLQLTNKDFDAIILDLQMPDMPGQRVIEFAREDVRLRHVPIIVVSANERWRAAVRALGVHTYLVKPVSMAQLTAQVADALHGC